MAFGCAARPQRLLRTENPPAEQLLAHSVALYPDGCRDVDCNWVQPVSGGCECMYRYRGNTANHLSPLPSGVRSVHVTMYYDRLLACWARQVYESDCTS